MKKKIEKVLSFFASINRDNPNYLFFKKQFLRKEKTKERVSEFAFITTVPGEPGINRMKKKI
ncbi:hypothetical protein ACXO1I_00005 [Lactobacillus delbrueckii subsp. bulgaricus]